MSSLSLAEKMPWVNDGGLAIGGYDVVAYFELGKALRGESQYTYQWQDMNWHFSNAAHRDLFAENPTQYAPQFAGYCANGLADAHLIRANPEHWRIIDNKLYLYFSNWGRLQWSFGVGDKIASAEKNWVLLRPDR
jgi:YHS domain-containing protein